MSRIPSLLYLVECSAEGLYAVDADHILGIANDPAGYVQQFLHPAGLNTVCPDKVEKRIRDSNQLDLFVIVIREKVVFPCDGVATHVRLKVFRHQPEMGSLVQDAYRHIEALIVQRKVPDVLVGKVLRAEDQCQAQVNARIIPSE